MKKTILFLSFIFFAFISFAQVPAGIASPKSNGFASYGYVKTDSAGIAALRDTLFNPKYSGTWVYWQNAGVDSAFWVFNGKTTGKKWDKITSSISGTGTVSSIATNNASGITGGTITTTGTLSIDTVIIATRPRVKKSIDSVAALIPNVSGYKLISDTLFNNGYTTRNTTKKIADSISALIPNVSGYKLISDTGFNNGYTTRVRLKQYGDSLALTKLNISDTANMLSPYSRLQYVNAQLSNKVNISDTAGMLIPYYRSNVANAALALKLNISDTAAMLSPYAKTISLGGYVPYTGATSDLNLGSRNLYVNNVFDGFSSIAASGTQVVLTVASVPSYLVTGSGGQTIKLPNATTLSNGAIYVFNNNQSSGAITINNNSNTLVKSVPSGAYLTLELLDNSTAAGSWDGHFQSPSNVSWSTNTFDYAGSITSATWNGETIAINRGGTGATTAASALSNLGGLAISDTATMLGGYKTYYPRAAISAGTGITYNSTTGVITNNSPSSGGTVTSVATNNGSGITGGTITGSGTLAIDTVIIASRLRVQKGIDSLGNVITSGLALKLNISDTASMLSTYARTTALSNYLPLSGGTLTGALTGTSFNVGEMTYNSNQIYRNSANEMYVNYSGTGNTILGNGTGNVSINAGTNPSYRLHVGGTLGVTGAATFSSNITASSFIKSGGTSTQYLMADGSVTTGGGGGGGISGSGVANQLTYWSGTSAVQGSTTLTYNTSGNVGMTISPSLLAASAIARGVNITSTLTAAANSDVLVGADFTPTFVNGSFTGVQNFAIRTNNSGINTTYSGVTSGVTPFGLALSNTTAATSGNVQSSPYLLFLGNNFFSTSRTDSIRIYNSVSGTQGSLVIDQNKITDLTQKQNIFQVKQSTAGTGGDLSFINSISSSVNTNALNFATQYRILTPLTIDAGSLVVNNSGAAAAPRGTSFFDVTGQGNMNSLTINTAGVLTASSILTVSSTTQGFLQPRMTTTQRDAISSPATGLQVYNTTTNTNDYYNGSAWTSQVTSSYSLKSANYTLVPTDDYINVSATATMTLPTAVGITGKRFTITNVGGVSTVITIGTTSSQSVINYDGGSSTILITQNKSITVVSNGANWFAISGFGGTTL